MKQKINIQSIHGLIRKQLRPDNSILETKRQNKHYVLLQQLFIKGISKRMKYKKSQLKVSWPNITKISN